MFPRRGVRNPRLIVRWNDTGCHRSDPGGGPRGRGGTDPRLGGMTRGAGGGGGGVANKLSGAESAEDAEPILHVEH